MCHITLNVYDLILTHEVGGVLWLQGITSVSVKPLDMFDEGPQHDNSSKQDTAGYFNGDLG